MYGSYGSYSSMSSVTQPLDIGSSSYLSSPAAYHQSSCAFPSWQRQERASSYLSDDDLLDLEDDSRSVSSSCTASNASGSPRYGVDDDLLQFQREQQAAVQREALRLVMQEKERRKQQAARRNSNMRHGSGSAKKSPKSKTGAAMAPILE